MLQKKKDIAFKSLTVNRLKQNECTLAAKLVWKVQNAVFNRNLKQGLTDLRRCRTEAIMTELTNENVLAQELASKRAEVFKMKQEAFS
jgi:hypothetical protein